MVPNSPSQYSFSSASPSSSSSLYYFNKSLTKKAVNDYLKKNSSDISILQNNFLNKKLELEQTEIFNCASKSIDEFKEEDSEIIKNSKSNLNKYQNGDRKKTDNNGIGIIESFLLFGKFLI